MIGPLPDVGIADLSTYTPERFMPASELAAVTEIPERVIIEKFGLVGKHIAAEDEHVSDMCIAAAQPIIGRTDPNEIDAVVYFGSHWKDYAVWQAAPKIQHALGIEGFSMELINVSAGAPVALKAVADMMRCDERLRSVLLVGASKESHLIDYANAHSRFVFTFGDGAVAVLLTREHARNHVLTSSILTDGSFADDVFVAAGGSKHPTATATTPMHWLDVRDPKDMKQRLDPITVKNFLKVSLDALERSGYTRDDVNWVLPIHVKRSIHDAILAEFGIGPEGSVYLDRHGHMSAVDPLFALCMARDRALLRPGDVIVLLAAGTGYTWAATVARWGVTA